MRVRRHLLLALLLVSWLGLSIPPARALDLSLGPAPTSETASSGPLHLILGGTRRLEIEEPASLWRGPRPLGLGAIGGPVATVSQWPLGPPAGSLLLSRRTSYSRLGLEAGPLRLQAQVVDARSQFTLPSGGPGASGDDEARLLREALGTRDLQFTADWSLRAGASLTSTYRSVRNDKPGDESQGLTTTDTGHALAFALGAGTQLTAKLQDRKESWALALGKPDKSRRTQAVELVSKFGGGEIGELKLSATDVATMQGERNTSQSMREVHLSLAPAGRLRLTADHVRKSVNGNADVTTQTAAAVLQLAPDAELQATLKANTDGAGSRTRQTDLKLTTALGGGATSGKLTAERAALRRPNGEAPKHVLKWHLSGGLGTGPARTNLTASVHEQRVDEPDGTLARKAAFHIDRALGPHVQFTLDRTQKLSGTHQSPQTRRTSTYALKADLGARTKLMTRLETRACSQGDEGAAQHLSLEHTVAAYRLRMEAERHTSRADAISVDGYTIEAPRGDLAEWAKDIGRAHQFDDANKYLAPDDPNRPDLPFAGTRVRTRSLRGGPDTGMDALEVAHRQMLGDRYHLMAAYQEYPEAREGDRKGRPMPLRRRFVEIGARLHGGLVAHGRYVADESTADPFRHRQDISIGLRGRLSDQGELEAAVSRQTGDWDDGAGARTRVSLMYALHVSDDHQVSLKGSYGWGGDSGSNDRESRVSLGYTKPI